MKKVLVVMLLGIIGLSICGCAGNGGTTANTATEKKGTGKTMTLDLKSNPTTGFDWEYETETGDDKATLDIKTDFVSEGKEGMVGVGGVRTYVITATKKGTQNIRFIYRRPWEGGETAYDVVYEIFVDDDLNIGFVGKKNGKVGGDTDISKFPDPVIK